VLAPAVERLVAAGSRVLPVAIEVTVSRAEPTLAEHEVDELLAVLAAAGAEPVRVRPGRAVEDELALVGAAR
jgi:hypothetical protein